MIGVVTAVGGWLGPVVEHEGAAPTFPARPIAKAEIDALNNNPGAKDPLKILFEKKGFTVDWDRDREVGAWHEVYLGDEMVLQVKQRVSIKRFKKWLREFPKVEADFFVASSSEGFAKFTRRFNA